MGMRGELFSTKVLLQNRTYFFNVKENRVGDLYLNIVESKNRDEGGFDRQSVILFADDLQEFLRGFDGALRIMEKEVRERRRGTKTIERDSKPDDKNDDKGGGRGAGRGKYPGADNKKTAYAERSRKGPPPKKGKRVVVKKK
ncbi:MAG: DUF3276 family protein [Treponema sp.]|jgi:hypothetical protein|nr:DUF3276 family protein [Treponema sp.]